MLKDLAIPLLQDRRKANRLVFFYKVVGGQVPALPCHEYLTPIRNKRQIRSKQFTDCVSSNSIDNQSTNNSKCFKPIQCRSELFRNSFFPKTVIDWNHVEDSVVCVETVNSFRKSCFSLGLIFLPALSPVASMLKGPETYLSGSRSPLAYRLLQWYWITMGWIQHCSCMGPDSVGMINQ